MTSLYRTGVGQIITCHDVFSCAPFACTIHRPTDHVLRKFPNRWLQWEQMMVRVCGHGNEHPDPDDMNVRISEAKARCDCDCLCCGRGGTTVVLQNGEA
jgi:hypothetical protein